MARPRIYDDPSSTTRARARRARLHDEGGRQLTLPMSREDMARIAALRAAEGLPSDAAAVRRALEIAAKTTQKGPSPA